MATSNTKSSKNSSTKAAAVAKPAVPTAKPAAAAVKPAAPPAPAAKPAPVKARPAPEPTVDEIRTRAFEIWVSEGCREGSDTENWLKAEKELRAGRR